MLYLNVFDITNQGTLPLVSFCSGTKMPLMRHQVPANSNVPVLVSQNIQINIISTPCCVIDNFINEKKVQGSCYL